jgi:hypothetical protein
MPQRTISAAGGNWNSLATWVEGAVPTTSDFVVGNGSSGQLTVNVAATIQYVDFTNYTQTLTFNSGILLQLSLAASTNTFGASMNFGGTGTLSFQSVASTIVQNTTNRIPNVRFTGNVTRTLSTNVYITNVETINAPTFNGNTMFINGNLFNNNPISISQQNIKGTTVLNLDGNGIISNQFSNTVIINSGSTYNTYGMGCVLENGANFTYQSGTTPTLFNIIYLTQNSLTDAITLNVRRTGCNLFLANQPINSGFPNKTINLSSSPNFNLIGIFSTSRPYTTDTARPNYIFSGNSISATTLNLIPVFGETSSNTNPPVSGSLNYRGIDIQLDRLYTHSIGSLQLNGGGIPTKPVIRSNSSGNQVSINLGSKITSQIIDYDFTDVNASGGQEIVAINGTLSNTTNITNVYPTGSGGGETSSVFIS